MSFGLNGGALGTLDGDALLRDRLAQLGDDIALLADKQQELANMVGVTAEPAVSRLTVFHGYMAVLVVAFLITLLTTPLMRRLAHRHGVVDRPNEARKMHRLPVAYLGGVAVYLGVLAGIFVSYIATLREARGLVTFHDTEYLINGISPHPLNLSILLGATIIMLTGLIDDVMGISPRIKIAGQLFAAAALAYQDIGVKLAAGLLAPVGQWLGNPDLAWSVPLPVSIPMIGAELDINVVYWAGTAVIAVFVIGACNASNLIDGLDGLLSGTTAIATAGLLVVALALAIVDDGPRAAQRIVLCMAVLGACLGFLPFNFNPASIFLGDCGSLLLGFLTIVIVLTLGDTGKTNLVLAGLIIYAIPIVDTALAIVRRKMNGQSISSADDQHLHHMLKRAFGVKGAVLSLYGLGITFASLGIVMSLSRARVSYALALIFLSYIGVTAIKLARRKNLEAEMLAASSLPPGIPSSTRSTEAAASAPPTASASPTGPTGSGSHG